MGVNMWNMFKSGKASVRLLHVLSHPLCHYTRALREKIKFKWNWPNLSISSISSSSCNGVICGEIKQSKALENVHMIGEIHRQDAGVPGRDIFWKVFCQHYSTVCETSLTQTYVHCFSGSWLLWHLWVNSFNFIIIHTFPFHYHPFFSFEHNYVWYNIKMLSGK